MVIEENNDILGAFPDEEEIEKVVFSLNGDSDYGPDGLPEVLQILLGHC